MDTREELLCLFDYELWATKRWIGPAVELRLESILVHVVNAASIWYSRVKGTEVWHPTAETLPEDLERIVADWKEVLSTAELGQTIHYKTLKGDPFSNTLLQIARHVINHGTYHRGELRGRAGERGFEGFEETDYILFCR